MEIERNTAEENAFTQPILTCHWQISKEPARPWNLKKLVRLDTRRHDPNEDHYFMFPNLLCFFSFRKLLQRSTCSVLWVSESVVVFKGKGNLLIELQKNCKRYPRSSHPMLICTLNFRYINGRGLRNQGRLNSSGCYRLIIYFHDDTGTSSWQSAFLW